MTGEQTELPREQPGTPVASEHDCEWCDDTAYWALERKDDSGRLTGQYIFACKTHGPLAHRIALNKKPTTKKE